MSTDPMEDYFTSALLIWVVLAIAPFRLLGAIISMPIRIVRKLFRRGPEITRRLVTLRNVNADNTMLKRVRGKFVNNVWKPLENAIADGFEFVDDVFELEEPVTTEHHWFPLIQDNEFWMPQRADDDDETEKWADRARRARQSLKDDDEKDDDIEHIAQNMSDAGRYGPSPEPPILVGNPYHIDKEFAGKQVYNEKDDYVEVVQNRNGHMIIVKKSNYPNDIYNDTTEHIAGTFMALCCVALSIMVAMI